jgi:hypothetical protein
LISFLSSRPVKAMPRTLFADILRLIADLRQPPDLAPA